MFEYRIYKHKVALFYFKKLNQTKLKSFDLESKNHLLYRIISDIGRG